MINDLDISSPHLWKFVDDATESEFVPKGGASNVQCIADRVIQWSHNNKVHLNADKCKELRISFAKKPPNFDPVIVGGKELEVVDSAKLLGVTISSYLSWNAHIDDVIKKASKQLYFLVQLKRAKVPPNDLVQFYTACIRSIIDYAIPAFYHALSQYLQKELVRLEKRAVSIIVPGASYDSGFIFISFTTQYVLDIADPSSTQDACQYEPSIWPHSP